MGLLAGEGRGYVSTAMAKIDKARAVHDLREAMLNHPSHIVRRETGYGLTLAGRRAVIPDFVQAFVDGKIGPCSHVGSLLAGCGPLDETLVRLLTADDSGLQRLGLFAVDSFVATGRPPGQAVAHWVRERLGEGKFKLSPHRRALLTKWSSTTG